MKNRLLVLLAVSGLTMAAQVTKGPAIGFWFLPPGSTVPVNKWWPVEAPFSLDMDAKGTPHLRFSLSSALVNCVADAQSNLSCTDVGTVGHLPTRYGIRNETPVQIPDDPTVQPPGPVPAWKLSHIPVEGATCWRNGLYQPPSAYTLTADVIVFAAWVKGDVLACDYEWQAPLPQPSVVMTGGQASLLTALSIDGAKVPFLIGGPAPAPGPCVQYGAQIDLPTASYRCVSLSGSLVWARIAMQTTWVP